MSSDTIIAAIGGLITSQLAIAIWSSYKAPKLSMDQTAEAMRVRIWQEFELMHARQRAEIDELKKENQELRHELEVQRKELEALRSKLAHMVLPID